MPHNKRIKKSYVIVIFFILFLNIFIAGEIFYQYSNHSQKSSSLSKEDDIQEKLKTSAIESFTNISWLKNGDFSSPSIEPWNNTYQGDPSDIVASNSSGQADVLVLGDNGTIEISNVFQYDSDWTPFNKSGFENNPNNGYDVGPNGVNCSHLWGDPTANQIPHIYWRYNVSLGRDLSDYEITLASIEAVMNASVNRNVDVPGDTIAAYAGDDPEIGANRDLNQLVAYDYIHFTVEVSDMEVSEDNTYLIAENRTRNLGRYDGTTPYLDVEKNIESKNETDIKFFLQRVIEADTDGHDNFTIILGISTLSADNTAPNFDYDYFDAMRIKSVNLTFSYRKKIDKSTTLSWYQVGNMINHTRVQVNKAEANFEYKINKDWNKTTLSQFSEFRVLINNKEQNKFPNVKLLDYNNSESLGNFKLARIGGFDLTNLIPIKENITFSIQVYIGDNFELDRNINISIDNVFLNISYDVFLPEGALLISSGGGGSGSDKTIEDPWIFLIIAIAAIIGATILGGYFLEYYFVLKYPKPVRKVRKYRKTLKKKNSPKIDIISREKTFNILYKKQISSELSKGKTSKDIAIADKIVKESLKSSSTKLVKEIAAKKADSGGEIK